MSMDLYSDLFRCAYGPYNEGRHREENHSDAAFKRLTMTSGEMLSVVAAVLGAGSVFRSEPEPKLKLQLATVWC